MKKRISRKVNLIGIGVALTFLGLNVLGQIGNGSPTLETRETSNNADQNLKSISRINPSTLAMELDLPLTTYPGRNGNSLPIGFSYSSKIWRIDTGMQWWYMANTQPRYVTDVYARFAERSAAGWTSNLLSPRIDLDNKLYDELGRPWEPSITNEAGLNTGWQNILNGFANNLEIPCGTFCTYWVVDDSGQHCVRFEYEYCDYPGGGGPILPEPPPPTPLFYIKRLHVAMPDGSNHEFRASDTPIACGTNQNVCTRDMTGTYLSVDGTGMRLVRESTGSSTLYMPNGARYLFTADDHADAYLDVNGNKLTFLRTNNTTSVGTTNKWIDSMGREIVDPMPHNWITQTQLAEKKTVQLPGLNGSQQYELTWANLKPRGCEADTSSNCVGANNVTGGALEEQTEKLYFETKYFCRGNISDNLVTQSNGEVLFPTQESGIRPCNSFDLQRNANGEVILDSNGNPIPFAPRFNPVVLSEVKLPNGKKYIFKYNRYGEITKIIYPTGSYETFVYSDITPMNGAGSPAYDQTNRGVTQRRVYDVGGALQQTWKYSAAIDYASGSYKITTKSSTGNDANAEVLRSERYIAPTYSDGSNFGFNSPSAGMPKEERIYDELESLRSRALTEYVTKDSPNASRDARVKRAISLTIENGLSLATLSEIDYDESGSTDPQYFSHLNAKQKKAYHYAVISQSVAGSGTLAQIAAYFDSSMLANIAETDYSYDPNYKARGIASLPIRTRVLNPTNPDPNNPLAKTETIYDNALPNSASNYAYSMQTYGTGNSFDCSGTSTPRICWQNPNGASGNIDLSYRGLPTTTRVWNSDTSTWIESHVQYDQFGNAVKARDPIGNETTTAFDSQNKYAYPTQVITPAPDPNNTGHGSNTPFTTSSIYDFNTGLPTSTTDINGQTTTMEYNDALLRPTKVIAPNGQQTITEYGDSPGNIFVKVSSQIDETNWKVGYKYFDALLRPIRTRSVDNAGDVYALTCYDNMSRVAKASNPFRGFTNQDCSTANGTSDIYWTTNTFDAAGRPWKITTPDNTIVETTYDLATSGSNIGTVTTVKDQGLKERRSITNALGQLVRVDEPNASGQLGSVTAPNQATNYSYDTLGKMVRVQQGVQNRYFMYDSLGRMLRVKQPEQEVNTALNSTGNPDNDSWTAGFTYDNNGNVLTTTDAKGTTITNTYDALNRPLTRTYSNEPQGVSTPAVTNYYDGLGLPSVPQFSKGKLTRVASSISDSRYTSFDVVGRLLSSEQRTPLDGETIGTAIVRTSSYQYTLSGALTQQTYPSGRVVNHEYDANGDIARISGKPTATATEQMYATGFSYFPDGKIEKLKLGNGLWESAKLNSRLQATEIAMGRSVGDGSLMKLNYEYGELNTDGVTVDATKNSGNIARQTVSFNGLAQPFVQTYRYDSLDRISEAIEKVNGLQTWKQTFGYDIYGNRNAFYQKVGEQELAMTNLTLPTVDQNTNRFAINQGYGYDKNGNITTDPANNGRSFIFNGDNKQTQVKNSGEITIGTYLYDGNGKRVKKVTDLETTVFVYDGLGKLVAEYSTATPPANPTINYTATDQLGSPRVLTDKLGNVVSRRDFMPFGEEIYANSTANRTEANRYSLSGHDSVRKRFTGYEKDIETGLDFAEARYYQNQHGRFTAVDPLLSSGKSANPQTFNRYVYCINSPLAFIDPNGLQVTKPAEKQKIFVFLFTVENEKNSKQMWKDVSRDAKKSGNVALTIYRGTAASLENYVDAWRTEGAIVISTGHNAGSVNKLSDKTVTGNRNVGDGITDFNGAALTSRGFEQGGELYDASSVEVNASKIMINSCNIDNFVPFLTDRMKPGSELIYNSTGNEGLSGMTSNEEAAAAQTRAVISGKDPVSAAQKVIDTPKNQAATDKFGNKFNVGDKIVKFVKENK